MQYKQASRILLEIVKDERTSAKVKLTVIELLMRLDPMPRLGPYKKRSTDQALWRMSSDSKLKPRERWTAVKALLAAAVKEQRRTWAVKPAASENAVRRDIDVREPCERTDLDQF